MVQTIYGRNTYAPRSAPPASGNCDPMVKQTCEGRVSAVGSQNAVYPSEEALTGCQNQGIKPTKLTTGENMRAYVLNENGNPLMPCKPAKARHLLRDGTAEVVRKTPFTIRLLWNCEEHIQPIVLGVDPGYRHVGLDTIDTENNREMYASEAELRTDIPKLLERRRMFRRTRRTRKTRYRKPRLLNRGGDKRGWLAPSIEHRIDGHVKLVCNVMEILPITEVHYEIAQFDIQKLQNPDISGEEYQHGEQWGSWNVREYILYRDNHECQNCHGKSGNKVLETHHIVSRKTGSNRPANLVTLCKTCHERYHKGAVELNIKPPKSFKAATQLNAIRWLIFNRLQNELDISVKVTYAYQTKHNRIKYRLDKSHINDAFVIAGGTNHTERLGAIYAQKQVRRNNRRLFKGDRSHIRNKTERFVKGFQRFDKVNYNGTECFIYGRRRSGYFSLKKLDGTKVHDSAKYNALTLRERATPFLTEVRGQFHPPALTDGVSLED